MPPAPSNTNSADAIHHQASVVAPASSAPPTPLARRPPPAPSHPNTADSHHRQTTVVASSSSDPPPPLAPRCDQTLWPLRVRAAVLRKASPPAPPNSLPTATLSPRTPAAPQVLPQVLLLEQTSTQLRFAPLPVRLAPLPASARDASAYLCVRARSNSCTRTSSCYRRAAPLASAAAARAIAYSVACP